MRVLGKKDEKQAPEKVDHMREMYLEARESLLTMEKSSHRIAKDDALKAFASMGDGDTPTVNDAKKVASWNSRSTAFTEAIKILDSAYTKRMYRAAEGGS